MLPPLHAHAPHGTRASGARWSCSAASLFLDGLDVSMVGVALPSIQADLGLIDLRSCSGSCRGYVLGYGGLLLLGGRAADLLGRRRVLLVALAVFTLASLLGGAGQRRHAARSPRASSRAPPRRSPRRPALSIITTTLHRGPGPQPGAQHLHRRRRQRLLARPRARRPADRARLALDVPAARAGRAALLLVARPRLHRPDRAARSARGAASTSPAP